MALEDAIKDCITQKLEEGIVEKLVSEQLEKGVKNALDHLLGSYGDLTKVIEAQLKSVMVPYLEQYDYSNYIVKLDSVLVDILKASALDNKKLLTNFKDLMLPVEDKTITVTKLFELWSKYVAENMDTSELEVEYDDGVRYESKEGSAEIEHDKSASRHYFDYATMVFSFDHDKDFEFVIRLSRMKDSKNPGWDMSYRTNTDIDSIRRLSSFEILLLRLVQSGTKLIIDAEYVEDNITPDKEPEATYG